MAELASPDIAKPIQQPKAHEYLDSLPKIPWWKQVFHRIKNARTDLRVKMGGPFWTPKEIARINESVLAFHQAASNAPSIIEGLTEAQVSEQIRLKYPDGIYVLRDRQKALGNETEVEGTLPLTPAQGAYVESLKRQRKFRTKSLGWRDVKESLESSNYRHMYVQQYGGISLEPDNNTIQ